MEIATLEGVLRATPGCYIVRGIEGEIYPCKKEIFEATYEKEENMLVSINREEVPKRMKELIEKGLPQSELINPCFWCPFSPPDCPYSTCHYTETRQSLQDLWVELRETPND